MINPLDAVIVLVLVASAVVSLWRGFLREALSLAGWVAAVWVALRFSPLLAVQLETWVSHSGARALVAALLVFVATLFTAALVNHWLVRLVRASGLSGTDRALGVLFGLVRGGVIVVLLLVAGRLLALDQASWWALSRLRPYFETLSAWLLQYLPQGVDPLVPLGG